MAERRAGVPEIERTIRNEDWYGRELDGVEYTGVVFEGVDLTEAHTAGATFTRVRVPQRAVQRERAHRLGFRELPVRRRATSSTRPSAAAS